MTVFIAASGERYRVVGDLGAGGFASIVHVEDEAGRRYALKHARYRGFALGRLRNEADHLHRIDHPNIICCHAAGSEPEEFLVVELAVDGSVQHRIDEARRLGRHIPLRSVVDWARQLLDGLTTVHTQTIHCDIRPSNVLFQRTVPKIIDFGSARSLEQTNPVGPLDTAALVTPPEGWLGARSAPPRPAYDLYGVGVTLFQLTTLRPPFLGSREDVRMQHLLRHPPRPTQWRPDLPEPLEQLILQLLSKDADQRSTSADCRDQLTELAEMLQPVRSRP